MTYVASVYSFVRPRRIRRSADACGPNICVVASPRRVCYYRGPVQSRRAGHTYCASVTAFRRFST